MAQMHEKSPIKLSPPPMIFRKQLLDWFEKTGRHDLPWRTDWSPYPIMVSEFMLQQTTVATVIPYFHKFMKTFPTVERLAAAPLDRVLELWSGLGYYARARNLQAAAQMIVKDFGGRMPSTAEDVKTLPGVGRYTAGAILSFAFNKPEPVVDGNVIRVLSRIYGIKENVKDPKTIENIWSIAWQLVPPQGARDYNSALMDLGATVCRPSGPDCLVCPFFNQCWARKHNAQSEIPMASADRPKKTVHVHAALAERKGRWALVQRPAEGLYGGLWEFPSVTAAKSSWTAKEAREAFRQGFGIGCQNLSSLPAVKHVLTHREMFVYPWVISVDETPDKDSAVTLKWTTLEEAEKMGISSLTRKVLLALKNHRGTTRKDLLL
jgi:A/G-specific adenine glycosylase